MPDIKVRFPDSLNDTEIKQVVDFIERIPKTEWEIFKENFEAFKRSFMDVCKAFWHKLVGWLRSFWNNLFN